MAYNNLSGTVLLPDLLTTRLDLVESSIISGNLSASNGADIINVPRLNNAVADGLVTNVGGDFNTLTSETNLTFDGSTLSVTGDLTASVGISASFVRGDGRYLTNVPGAGGSGAGIFTEINGTQANTTSSILVGSDATPATTVHVVGSSFFSGAVTHKRTFVNSNYSVSATDYYIGVGSEGAAITLTLPAATGLLDGQTLIVKDEGGNAHNNHITITGSADSNTIDGKNKVILESPYSSISLYCNGANKFFIV